MPKATGRFFVKSQTSVVVTTVAEILQDKVFANVREWVSIMHLPYQKYRALQSGLFHGKHAPAPKILNFPVRQYFERVHGLRLLGSAPEELADLVAMNARGFITVDPDVDRLPNVQFFHIHVNESRAHEQAAEILFLKHIVDKRLLFLKHTVHPERIILTEGQYLAYDELPAGL